MTARDRDIRQVERRLQTPGHSRAAARTVDDRWSNRPTEATALANLDRIDRETASVRVLATLQRQDIERRRARETARKGGRTGARPNRPARLTAGVFRVPNVR